MILTESQYATLREHLHERTLVGTPKQREVANNLLIYFNIWFVNTKDTDKITEEIAKDIARWKKKDDFNPRFGTKGNRLTLPEIETLDKVQTLLDSTIGELAKKDRVRVK